MDCRQAQDEILEMFDGSPSAAVHVHLAGCAACAAFLKRQTELDRQLSHLLDAPELSAGFRSGLRRRIRRESARLWPEALPDLVHVGSCLAATAVCAVALPVGPGPVLATGALITGGTYAIALVARSWLDA
jgi:hypothetical protein